MIALLKNVSDYLQSTDVDGSTGLIYDDPVVTICNLIGTIETQNYRQLPVIRSEVSGSLTCTIEKIESQASPQQQQQQQPAIILISKIVNRSTPESSR